MRSTLSKVKWVAVAFVAAAFVAGYVPVVADVLTAVVVASWAAIVAALGAPVTGRLRPYLPVWVGYAHRAARVARPWLSPRPVLARLRVSRAHIGSSIAAAASRSR